MTTQSKAQVAKPTHRLYRVSGTGKKANWTLIGAAWPNRDGAGFSLQLEALPVNGGRIVMRAITEKEAA